MTKKLHTKRQPAGNLFLDWKSTKNTLYDFEDDEEDGENYMETK